MKRFPFSRALYRVIVLLYPRRFRLRFQDAMLADFEELLRTDGRIRAWRRVVVDAFVSIPAEHAHRARRFPAKRSGVTSGLGRELAYVARTLVKAPTYTAVAAVTLALGIGATTAIFSLVRTTLLDAPPFDAPDRVVAVWQWRDESAETNSISPATFRDFDLRATVFSGLAAHNQGWLTLTQDDAPPDVVQGGFVETDFFDVLGVAPALGRNFHEDEGRQGNHYVVLLSAEFWRGRFGLDPDIVGKELTLDRERYRIIGVMPEGLDYPRDVELWRPLALEEERWTTQRGSHFLGGVARLRDGVSVEAARAELKSIASNLALEYPDTNEGWGAEVVAITDELVAEVRPSLLLLQASVLLVLAIACVNVAGLQIGRADRRRVELAIRSALGAGFWRLTRLLLLESVVVALTGASLGLFVAWTILALMRPLSPIPLESAGELLGNGSVLAFVLLASLATGVFFGLAPALSSSTRSRLVSSRSRHRLREGLVVAEIAVALVLLVGAGWFLQSFYRLSRVDPGVATENVLTARVSIPRAVYPEPRDRVQFFEELNERMRQLPSVESASLASLLPVTGSPGWWRNSFYRPEHPPATPADQVAAYLRWVAPGYMETVGIAVVRGRDIASTDTAERPKVVLIDQAFAREFFPGEDPLGKRIVVEYDDWDAEIVGIVGDTRQTSLKEGLEPHMYLPYRQTYGSMYLGSMAVVVRTRVDPMTLVGPLREAVRELDPHVAVVGIETMERRLESSVGSDQFRLTLVTGFAVVALVLALVGLYGVIASMVSERRAELGVRIALGAKARDVLVMVLSRSARLVSFGIAAGSVASLALGKLVAPFLFEVSTSDAVTLGAVSLLLIIVALAAVWIPARSAARVDPIIVLRYE